MWTTDHTCGLREAVDERGQQPEGPPSGLAMMIESKRPRALAEEAEGERQKTRQTRPCSQSTLLLVIHLPHNSNNDSNSNNRRSSRSNALAVAATQLFYVIVVTTFILYCVSLQFERNPFYILNSTREMSLMVCGCSGIFLLTWF